MLYAAIRPLLFRFDSEEVHEFATRRLEAIERHPRLLQAVADHYLVERPVLETEVWGLRFPNPIGVAAGFDKNARLTRALPALGFGFVEVGTVTSEAQAGNPKPRLFRLPKDRALVNRLGFNNEGAEAVAARLARAGPGRVPLGVNIGKLKKVANDDAVRDYLTTFERLFPYGQYFVVNVSSPNTPGLRALQESSALKEILTAIRAKNQELAKEQAAKPRPLLVKIAPDLEAKELEDVLAVAQDVRMDGIIATNTTVSREGLQSPAPAEGGLSGAPLRARSTAFVKRIFNATDGRLPIIGVGGVLTAEDALEKIEAGASLVQLYTGFIYGGPSTPSRMAEVLADLLEEAGYKHVGDAVGARA